MSTPKTLPIGYSTLLKLLNKKEYLHFQAVLTVLGRSSTMTIVKAEKEEIQDWVGHLSLFYSDFKEKRSGIIKNHFFGSEYSKTA
jgi:hypothetical protein